MTTQARILIAARAFGHQMKGGGKCNMADEPVVTELVNEEQAKQAKALQRHLRSIGACRESRDWAKGLTAKQAWENCTHQAWLFWWASRTGVNSRQSIVLAACDCARAVLHLVKKPGEDRPRLAIEAAEAWCKEPTEENRRKAADAARAAWDAAYAAYAAAAYAAAAYAAAAYAADAAYAAYADAAADAADAADGAAAAAAIRHASKRLDVCAIIRARLVQPWGEDRAWGAEIIAIEGE